MAWQLPTEYLLSLQSLKKIDGTLKQSAPRWVMFMDLIYKGSLVLVVLMMSLISQRPGDELGPDSK
jgi:hypothetical protein